MVLFISRESRQPGLRRRKRSFRALRQTYFHKLILCFPVCRIATKGRRSAFRADHGSLVAAQQRLERSPSKCRRHGAEELSLEEAREGRAWRAVLARLQSAGGTVGEQGAQRGSAGWPGA